MIIISSRQQIDALSHACYYYQNYFRENWLLFWPLWLAVNCFVCCFWADSSTGEQNRLKNIVLHFLKNYWQYENSNNSVGSPRKIPFYWNINHEIDSESFVLLNSEHKHSYLFFINVLESVNFAIYLHFFIFFSFTRQNIFLQNQQCIIMLGKRILVGEIDGMKKILPHS